MSPSTIGNMPIDAATTRASLLAAADDRRLEQACATLGIELLVLFGSGVDAETPADVDLAVGYEPEAEHDLLALLDAVAGLAPGDHVDVLDLDRAGPVARVQALTRGRVLVERTPGVFTRREMFALGEYAETSHMREALLRELAR